MHNQGPWDTLQSNNTQTSVLPLFFKHITGYVLNWLNVFVCLGQRHKSIVVYVLDVMQSSSSWVLKQNRSCLASERFIIARCRLIIFNWGGHDAFWTFPGPCGWPVYSFYFFTLKSATPVHDRGHSFEQTCQTTFPASLYSSWPVALFCTFPR